MNVFVAGASGAIGRPLVLELIRRGHAVTGMTRSDAGEAALLSLGAEVARVGAFDAEGLGRALRRSGAEVVVDELTALPRSPADIGPAEEGDRRLRVEGGGNLLGAAGRLGVRRYLQQSSGFFLRPGPGLGDEREGLAVDASPRVARMARTFAEVEARLLDSGNVEGVVLRYGFFYGPGTWYDPAGAAAGLARRGEIPIVGDGEGVWSWVHVVDAAVATADAIDAPPGVYHVVDDDPSPVADWLPAFARSVGAPPPPRASAAGDDEAYYGTKLRGASNARARRVLGFRPRRLEWLGA